MIKASDLRIGNLVISSSKIIAIESIDKYGVNVFYCRDYGEEYWCLHDNLTPIPLTEEWLLKFGFEKSIIGMRLNVFLFSDGVMCIPDGQEARELPHIKYVHQLQNLFFALTDKELTVNEAT